MSIQGTTLGYIFADNHCGLSAIYTAVVVCKNVPLGGPKDTQIYPRLNLKPPKEAGLLEGFPRAKPEGNPEAQICFQGRVQINPRVGLSIQGATHG